MNHSFRLSYTVHEYEFVRAALYKDLYKLWRKYCTLLFYVNQQKTENILQEKILWQEFK